MRAMRVSATPDLAFPAGLHSVVVTDVESTLKDVVEVSMTTVS